MCNDNGMIEWKIRCVLIFGRCYFSISRLWTCDEESQELFMLILNDMILFCLCIEEMKCGDSIIWRIIDVCIMGIVHICIEKVLWMICRYCLIL